MTKSEAITKIKIAKDIITEVELAVGHSQVDGISIPYSDSYIYPLIDCENSLAYWLNCFEDENE